MRLFEVGNQRVALYGLGGVGYASISICTLHVFCLATNGDFSMLENLKSLNIFTGCEKIGLVLHF
jgi:hypothetical protein